VAVAGLYQEWFQWQWWQDPFPLLHLRAATDSGVSSMRSRSFLFLDGDEDDEEEEELMELKIRQRMKNTTRTKPEKTAGSDRTS
jgi:hypothetical protein